MRVHLLVFPVFLASVLQVGSYTRADQLNDGDLLLATLTGLRTLSVSSGNVSSISSQGTTSGVTFNYKTGQIYWTIVDSPDENGIYTTNNKTGAVERVLPIEGNAYGLAYDWISGNIYHTDGNEWYIRVCNPALNCSPIVREHVGQPNGLALNPKLGEMYWTNRRRVAPTIAKASMDGSSPVLIVQDLLVAPVGIVVDIQASRLYWLDTVLAQRIETSDLNGGDRRVVKTISAWVPFGIGLVGETLYWSDYNTINSISKTGGNETLGVYTGTDGFKHIAGFAGSNQPQDRVNSCESNPCEYLCVLAGASYACKCPEGTQLGEDMHSCVLIPQNREE